MLCLPLITRELRVRARNPATYWLRLAVGLVGLLICLPQLLLPPRMGGTANLGTSMFYSMAGAGLVLCCAACLLTADSISSERREDTLGLLFLTHVKSLDLLLGKFGAAGINGLCGVLMLVPLLMVPVLAGGVTGGEALRLGFVLFNVLFFGLAAGLYSSARGMVRGKTVGFALALVAALMVGPLVFGQLFGVTSPKIGPQILSPLMCFLWARDALYKIAPSLFWLSLAALHGLSWLLVLGAGLQLNRNWRKQMGALPSATPIRPEQPAPFSIGAAGLSLANLNPVEWLLRRHRSARTVIWAAALVTTLHGLFPMIWWLGLGNPSFIVAVTWPTGFVVVVLVDALIAYGASRFFIRARQTGEFELLRTTPAGARLMTSGQWSALKHWLCWPLLLMCLPLLGQLLFLLAQPTQGSAYWTVQGALWVLLSVALVCLRVGALCWLGMWYGLKAKNQGHAIVWTIALVDGVPYLIYLLVWLSAGLLFMGLAGSRSWPGMGMILQMIFSFVPNVIAMAYLLWLLPRTKQRLENEFAQADPGTQSWREDLAEMARLLRADFQKARQWTPY